MDSLQRRLKINVKGRKMNFVIVNDVNALKETEIVLENLRREKEELLRKQAHFNQSVNNQKKKYKINVIIRLKQFRIEMIN